jgi:hypothetical protein
MATNLVAGKILYIFVFMEKRIFKIRDCRYCLKGKLHLMDGTLPNDNKKREIRDDYYQCDNCGGHWNKNEVGYTVIIKES